MIQYKNFGVTVVLTGEYRNKTGLGAASFRKPRIALYSHDTMGLGHIRRNLLIARALSCSSLNPEILLITGARHAAAFSLPYRTSRLILPAFHKDSNGEYRPEYRGASLRALIDFRSATILSAIEDFDPDVLIVDKVARGALRELDSTLDFLRNKKTVCVLGLRDVLDAPHIVRGEWKDDSFEDAIRDYYDSIWVYGDRTVYDSVHEYQFAPDIADKVIFTGYHDQRFRIQNITHQDETDPFILCLVGGGQDGAQLVEAFARCTLPAGMKKIVLSGPYMSRISHKRLERLAATDPCLKVYDFLVEPKSLITKAERVIAMGGYNTICEVLSYEKVALIVPRVSPRWEQLIRAERMHAMGLLDLLRWEEASPAAFSQWVQEEKSPPVIYGRVDMGGLDRIPEYVSALLSKPKTENAAWI